MGEKWLEKMPDFKVGLQIATAMLGRGTRLTHRRRAAAIVIEPPSIGHRRR
jgi:hypothetical protein